ncbi:MAG: hypothetical protein IPM21_18125 [Acidobacteria bacterium]|nr:hypothetical protein [Acidobacteriota bacterium]
MSELPVKYDIEPRELARGRNLRLAAIASPVVLTLLPVIVSAILFVLFASSPPVAATILFFGFLITAIGFLKGAILSGIFGYKYSRWRAEIREMIAVDGIKANEVEWFRHELKPQEKRALKEMERNEPLLADAYRETLASRLTATRVIRATRKKLSETKRRESKLRQLKTERQSEFLESIRKDADKIGKINADAQGMLGEAEARLQMIEAAVLRGGSLAGTELAMKRLSARSSELPLALQEAQATEEIRLELESEAAAAEQTLLEK